MTAHCAQDYLTSQCQQQQCLRTEMACCWELSWHKLFSAEEQDVLFNLQLALARQSRYQIGISGRRWSCMARGNINFYPCRWVYIRKHFVEGICLEICWFLGWQGGITAEKDENWRQAYRDTSLELTNLIHLTLLEGCVGPCRLPHLCSGTWSPYCRQCRDNVVLQKGHCSAAPCQWWRRRGSLSTR